MSLEKNEMHDLHGPAKMPIEGGGAEWMVPVIIVAVVLIAIAAATGILYWKRRRSIRSVEEETHEAIQRIEAQANTMEPSAFASEVSRIARAYAENTFSFPALEMTEPQFYRKLASRFAEHDVEFEELKTFGQQCELLKYSSSTFAEEEKQSLLEMLHRIIEQMNTLKQMHYARN